MPITYRQHPDMRDGKIYQCVLMPDGKWWSAENLAWSGAGVAYNDDPAMEVIYGRLYTWVEATSNCPTGTHTPSQAEYALLLSSIPDPDGTKLKANSSLWSTNTGTDDYGFKALPGGNAGYLLGDMATFWTSTELNVDDGYQLQLTSTSNNATVTNQTKPRRNSVRFIVDVFNEPTPPTKIKGTFSGSGVRAFMSIKSLGGTLEITIASQTTSSLTIDLTFIETWGKQSGPVQIMVVDGEYISEWIDWEFK